MAWSVLIAVGSGASELAAGLRAQGLRVEVCGPEQLAASARRLSPDVCVAESGGVAAEGGLLELSSPAGASSFLPASAGAGTVAAAVEALARSGALLRELAVRRAEQARRDEWVLAGTSDAARRLAEAVERVASTPRTTVLVSGPPGAGKRSLARLIHWRSSRSGGPLVEVESGAVKDLVPLERAEGGTLVLARVERLEDDAQARLAELLAAGGDPGAEPDVRVVATAQSELFDRVERGRFREDLLYRLNVLSLKAPALAERLEDLPALARDLIGELDHGPEVLAALARRDWPGNLRELALTLQLADLEPSLDPQTWTAPPPSRRSTGGESNLAAGAAQPGGALRAAEEALIRRVLQETGGNKARCAEILGIHRTTLYHKLKSYRID